MSLTTNRLAFALTLTAASLAASAGTPAALDRVPANAEVVVTIAELDEFLTDVDYYNNMLGANASIETTFVTSMIRGFPGINLDGSAAIILDLPDDPNANADPTMVAIIPTSDFNALTQNREAVDGIVQMQMPDAVVFARDLGNGFAAISDLHDVLAAYDGAAGNLAAHQATLGTSGQRLVNHNDFTIFANAAAIRPYLDAMLDEMNEQGQMVAVMGGDQAAAGFNMFENMLHSAVRDLSSGVLALDLSETGLNWDFAMQFQDDSESASYFAEAGSTAGLIDHLPDTPYFFAGAFDSASPTMQKISNAYQGWIEQQPEEVREAMLGTGGGLNPMDLLANSEGFSFVMGTPPALMGGGLFAKTSYFVKSDDPNAYLNAAVDAMRAANGSTNGLTVNATVTEDAITVDGTDLTSYGMTYSMDPQALQASGIPVDPTMVMGMVFGPTGGPAGYMGATQSGVVATLSQSPEYAKAAVAAAKAGEGLGAKTALSNALQNGRIAEIYVGLDEILNSVGPTLMMFGMIPEFAPVEAMNPVALGLTSDSGGMTGRIHIPASTLQTALELIPDDMGNGGMGGDDGFTF